MKLDVQAGDQIVYYIGYARLSRITKVVRVTKTQAVCEGNERFMLDGGKKVGSNGWHITTGRKATPEDIAEISIAMRIRKANNELKEVTVTAENLAAAEAFLDALDVPSDAKEPE